VTRTRIGAAPALLALALLLTLPGGSGGDSSSPTWAGTWSTDFGEMTLDAGGSGDYVSPFGPNSSGTVEGNVDGRVNTGRWKQPNSSGTFIFTMSGDGLSFTGDWQYDGGGCGSSCGWNGECTAGPCLENDDPPPQMNQCEITAGDARASAKCNPKSLPFGSDVSVPAPGESKPVEVSPERIPATADEVAVALRELIEEEEKNELKAALVLALEKDPKLGDAFFGCLLIGSQLRESEGLRTDDEGALLKACKRLLIDNTARPGAAAAGCDAVFVPAFAKGEKVTKRRRRRVVNAVEDRLAFGCKQRPGRLSLSIRARKGKTLRSVTGRRIRAVAGRRLRQGSPSDQRLGVRWRDS